jgi:hypothetical protein
MINNFMVPKGLQGLTQEKIKELVVGETAKIMAEKGIAVSLWQRVKATLL